MTNRRPFDISSSTLVKIVLSLVFLCASIFNCIQMENVRFTTTTTTKQPFVRSPGLSLPRKDMNPSKCKKEVPAIFFQYEKDVPIRGNSSTGNPNYNEIDVCCPGFKRYDFDWSKCVPDCGNKCLKNGFCLEGGVCQCFDEFVLNHRNDCVPTCPLGCPNGRCYLNGTCVCNSGYELDPTKKYCVPICKMGCGRNEICVEPERCECAEGYSRSPNHQLTKIGCQPICIPDCGFGYCSGPNKCECFPGYGKKTNGTVCEYLGFLRCDNGFQVRGPRCICQEGYRYDENTTSCLPDCGDDCDNGVCISPGICRCFNGYQRNGPKCEAICEHGCGYYGKCIAPGVCGCSITDGPFKTYQKCELGYCTSKGRCRCQTGTTRFINQCLSPDKVTTYATMHHQKLNEDFVDEFNLLIGRYFNFTDKLG
ncbi:epidermal growth factor-like protein [Musca domestica]|uniref:von Willebrand factor D and EGF domain-containing protein n=1 Tax=Musca domestica TaxID=7370 RepID=A0A1I8M0P3_MUSDO|nr:epidermal growth factor-like protein [Musca domestica]